VEDAAHEKLVKETVAAASSQVAKRPHHF